MKIPLAGDLLNIDFTTMIKTIDEIKKSVIDCSTFIEEYFNKNYPKINEETKEKIKIEIVEEKISKFKEIKSGQIFASMLIFEDIPNMIKSKIGE